MKEYIILPKTKKLSDSCIERRKLNDTDWKNYIFFHLLQFYREVDDNEIINLIIQEKRKPISAIEKAIKKRLKQWLKNDQRFDSHCFIINTEPSSDGETEGFYDLKFEHSDWRKKYFVFECKNLDTYSASIDKYVYYKEIQKGCLHEDGGMYRYMINKYAKDLDFGGMIGFVIAGDSTLIIEKIIQKIHDIFDNNDIGQLTDKCITRNSIENNSNTFDSIHLRLEENKIKKHIFMLHHIIMVFTSS